MIKEDCIRIIFFAALAAATLTACQQELNIDENKMDTPVVFTATTESSATKTALSQNGENYDVLWQDGDQITIVDAGLNVSTTISDKKVRRIILSADQGMSGAIGNAATPPGPWRDGCIS